MGTGTAASCTFAALNAAVTKGGPITFNCGAAPATISVTATLTPPITKNTVIDGGNLVTLDGGSAVQILRWNSPNWQAVTYGLTLQNLTVANGKMTGTQSYPAEPAPCSSGYYDGQGGAIFMRDGNLTIINSVFKNNQAALLGPDTGGGAIYITGSLHGALIVNSTFTNNRAASGGAVGALWADLNIYNSVFTGNTATGFGANGDDQSQCAYYNTVTSQYQTGSGGDGGAIYQDGNNVSVLLCGDNLTGNTAGTGAFGSGVFMVSDNMAGNLTITDSKVTGNTGGSSWTNGTHLVGIQDLGSQFGVNANTITVKNSTLQGSR